MTYDEYWYGHPLLVRDYLHAEEYKRQADNRMSWLQGMYMSEAIMSTICNAFLEKGAEPHKYPDKPYPVTDAEIEQAKQEAEDKEAKQAELFMRMFVEKGKNWGKKPLDDAPQ